MRTRSIIFFILAAMLSAMPVSAQFGRIVGSLDQLGKKKEQPQTQQTNRVLICIGTSMTIGILSMIFN